MRIKDIAILHSLPGMLLCFLCIIQKHISNYKFEICCILTEFSFINLQLYDLMTMAFKYQVSLCLRPKEIILITLNHMDAIRAFVEGQPNIKQQVDHVYRLLIQVNVQDKGVYIYTERTIEMCCRDLAYTYI